MGMLDRLKAAATERKAEAAQRAYERAKRALPGATGLDIEFAVVDVETTGLDARVDRIIEIAVLIANTRGEVIDEFCTLVDPGDSFEMSTGARRVNLIDPEWLKAAPPTSAVLPHVAHRINGRFLVGHNSKFDTEFLEEEFRRAFGWSYDDLGEWTSLCTLGLCRDLGLPRRLDAACGELGIRYEKHSALGDCHATFKLLNSFMTKIDRATFTDESPTMLKQLPSLPAEFQPVMRGDAQVATTARPVLDSLINSLPAHDGTADRDPDAVDAYLVALQDAIADGFISETEVTQLSAVANRYGLTSNEIRDLHQELIMGLVDTALEDNKVSKTERAEIERLATWLGVDTSDWTAMVKAARAGIKAKVIAFREDMAGKTVAFTGSGIHKPNIREALVAKHGIEYSTRVSELTDLVVIGTEATDTQAVGDARDSGIPIMVESMFWRQLGEV